MLPFGLHGFWECFFPFKAKKSIIMLSDSEINQEEVIDTYG